MAGKNARTIDGDFDSARQQQPHTGAQKGQEDDPFPKR